MTDSSSSSEIRQEDSPERRPSYEELRVLLAQRDRDLRESQERLERLSAALIDYVFHVRVENGAAIETRHGPGSVRVTGYSGAELEADPTLWIRMVPEEDRPIVQEQLRCLFAGEEAPMIEHRIVRKDGEVRWVSNTPVPQRDASGQLLGYDGLLRDVTARKVAEDALRRKTEELDSFFTSALDLLCIASLDGTALRLNPEWTRALGYPLEEMEGKSLFALIHPEDQKAASEAFGRLAEQKPILALTNRLRHADGTYRWIDWRAYPAQQRVYAAARDVTDRLRAERALRESERTFATLVSNLPGFVYRCANDRDWTMTYMSDGCLEVTGYSPEDFLQNRAIAYNQIIRADHQERIWTLWQEQLAQQEPCEATYPIVTATGEERWVWERGRGVFSETGALLYLEGFITDVSHYRRANEALQASEERYRTLVESSPDVIMQVDRQGRFLYVNPSIRRISKRGPEEYLGKTVRELQFPPALCELWETKVPEVYDTGVPWEAEMEVATVLRGTVVVHWRLIPLRNASGVVDSVLNLARDMSDQRRVEKDYKTLFEQMLDAFAVHEILCDENGTPIDYRYLAVNPAFERITGLSAERALGHTATELFPGLEQYWIEIYGRVALTGEAIHFEDYSADLKRHFEVTAFQPEPRRFACIFRDITDRRLFEERFYQSQKMDAVGRLAAGVAHDLNNLLTPILGYTELLSEEFGVQDARLVSIREVNQAGRRARDLVRQLLAFSRKQKLEFKTVELNAVVLGFEKLLRRTVREDIQVRLLLAEGLPSVRADVGQIEQILMNLALNAQDSMAEGGTLTIETSLEADLPAGLKEADEKSEPRVVLRVRDTGCGMTDEVRSRIFEPFFTTKSPGKGTGLGLATVHGIVEQHSGRISVLTAVGSGTTFKISFPAHCDTALTLPETEVSDEQVVAGVRATIVVVEDNDIVRNLAVAVLRRQGYTVFSYADGATCVQSLGSEQVPVDLLLTDVIMPDMNGKALFERMVLSFPALKVVYMSGYSSDLITNRGVLDHGVAFLQKPFSVKALAAKVREVLESV